LFYSNGTTFSYSKTLQQWAVPDSNGDGGKTIFSRNVTGGIAYGDWTVEQIAASGAMTSTHTLTGTIPSESLTLTTGSSNPFITGAGVTTALQSGLSVAQGMALLEATGTPITFADKTASVAAGNCYTFTLDLSAASSTAQTIQLALTGGANNMVVDGNTKEFINFSGGTATITVPAGQSSLQLTIIDGSTATTPEVLTLSATITGANGATSNNLNITFNALNPTVTGLNPITPTVTNQTINGVSTPINVYTGDGANDQISTASGINSINGGAGNDLIIGNGAQDVIVGGNGSNQIYANTQITVAAAIAQQSTAAASGQKGDLIAVGDGNNTIVGGNGNDLIFTGTGNNTIVLGAGSVTVNGGVEVTSPGVQWSVNTTYTNEANGYLMLYPNVGGVSGPAPANYNASTYNGNFYGSLPNGMGNDTIYGGTGNNTYWLSNGNNWLNAGGGADLIMAGIGNNTIYGGAGNDVIWGGGGNSIINLESGNDLVVLQGGNQTVFGGTGNDTIYSGNDSASWADSMPTANNWIEGSSGNSIIYGSGGSNSNSNSVSGGSGNYSLDVANDFEWRMQA
jgi:Ca2+-binding RTX toxin-like protein